MQSFEIIAKTLFGLEEILAKEIEELGGKHIKILKRAISFEGDDFTLYKLSMGLRTALALQVPIAQENVQNENDLYDFVYSIPWPNIFNINHTFSIEASTFGELFTHSKYAALKAKDAIADHFRDKLGQRPSVNKDFPDIKIQIHIAGKTCTVLLDTSPNGLDKRGYRVKSGVAPMNEVLAAGILKIAEFEKHSRFYDPMCGTGTFSIEAALMALNRAPNLNKKFCFYNWNDFSLEVFQNAKKDLIAESIRSSKSIYTSDINREALSATYENMTRANVAEEINLYEEDFFNCNKKENGLVVLNPPYDKRISLEDTAQYYSKIGDILKNHYHGSKAWIISSNIDGFKSIGLKTSKRIDLYNGGLPAKLCLYDLY